MTMMTTTKQQQLQRVTAMQKMQMVLGQMSKSSSRTFTDHTKAIQGELH